MRIGAYSLRQVLAVIAVCVFLCAIVFQNEITRLYQDARFPTDPSAERASRYAEEAFSALNKNAYDVERAQYYYEKAYALDPDYPHVNHQLARIKFLQGDFPTALMHIDREIELYGDGTPNSYYVRALIKGYEGDYDGAADDYAHFLEFQPENWAAVTDRSWVLLKAGRAVEAATQIEGVLGTFPDNPWLLNTYATALFETGRVEEAQRVVRKAYESVQKVTESMWLVAYPGNDPSIARQGLEVFQSAVESNMHTIELRAAEGGLQDVQ